MTAGAESGADGRSLLFLVGGARSGKSRLAQDVAVGIGRPVTFVATATAGDADMAARIARHQADRPSSWDLVEAPIELEPALGAIDRDRTVVVDCLTMWVANLVLAEVPETEIAGRTEAVAGLLTARSGCSVVVSNEVGFGVHPPTELGRRYQDVLGRVNQLVAARAGRSLLLVAGRALTLDDPADLLAGWPPD